MFASTHGTTLAGGLLPCSNRCVKNCTFRASWMVAGAIDGKVCRGEEVWLATTAPSLGATQSWLTPKMKWNTLDTRTSAFVGSKISAST